MKKIVLLFACFVAMVGCSKNIDYTDPTVKKLEVVMNIETISADVLNYFTVQYIYTDFAGNTVTKPITKPEKISFSIDNPSLGEEESTPFTVQLKLTQNKDAATKPSGNYDSSFKWQLDVNAYDQRGALITDSGEVQYFSSSELYNNDKFSDFRDYITMKGKMREITYKTFFCKTISGEWHIGVKGLEYSGAMI